MYFFTQDFIPGKPLVQVKHSGDDNLNPQAVRETLSVAAAPPSIETLKPANGAIGFFTGTLRVPVKWYFCKPTAVLLPFSTAFGSSVWDMESEGCDGTVGEDRYEYHPYYNGKTPTTAIGTGHYCGQRGQYLNGFAFGSYAGITYDPQDIPLCCGTQAGAAAVTALGFGQPHISTGSIIVGGTPPPPIVGLSGLTPATGSISFAGTTWASGNVRFGETKKPGLIFGGWTAAKGAIGLSGNTTPPGPTGGALVVGGTTLDAVSCYCCADLLAGIYRVRISAPGFPFDGLVANCYYQPGSAPGCTWGSPLPNIRVSFINFSTDATPEVSVNLWWGGNYPFYFDYAVISLSIPFTCSPFGFDVVLPVTTGPFAPPITGNARLTIF